ncbi:tRNA (adenosine(37)-N6)-threonylcarbamoyltransferase complex dimerization subunit type 1 TsaB [Candidatus Chloroploca asiatica]|uniref:tRNA N6-adenosine(37)-N6-threonylcarbamoyltransferase complex dimerization subunit TsaB n=1 Tax=Candidatus Chloroploca asiatica TaxID=1506545 RepID=A0A2H3KG53_9CHLR|nr:tRNA (adenosine(37)-N6)-threonylcarbamoyltransferase complex dimerization subunit type 1 TsaB [Candidatus Chloroploca asiatica]PDV96705.1 tRNA N6-adenosine(37)-N6-threonylcarbamoyltransferase complex dimerization subunit TsaB [Candidatus Chloroploca asiatica]
MLLALDTSTALTGLALYDERGLRAECVWESGRNHTAQLLPQLDLLLRHAGVPPSALSVVAVALGPGSWSGLRVGLSLAKGFVLARSLPLIGLGTLDVLAYQYAYFALPTCPLIRLGRDRFATARFVPDVSGSLRQEPDINRSLAELCAQVQGPTLFCGDLDATSVALLRQTLGDDAWLVEPAAALRRPGYLAELAWQRHLAGAYDDPLTLEPFYLGEPVRA